MPPRERRKLQPRSPDAILNSARTARKEKQRRWENVGGRGPFPVIDPYNPSMPHTMEGQIRPGWLQASTPRNDQSGIMLALSNNPMVNRIQSIYNQADPFIPEIDLRNQTFGYDINRDLWGGNLNVGGEYDVDDDGYQFGINWSKSF